MVEDVGAPSLESVDYPDFGASLASRISSGALKKESSSADRG